MQTVYGARDVRSMHIVSPHDHRSLKHCGNASTIVQLIPSHWIES